MLSVMKIKKVYIILTKNFQMFQKNFHLSKIPAVHSCYQNCCHYGQYFRSLRQDHRRYRRRRRFQCHRLDRRSPGQCRLEVRRGRDPLLRECPGRCLPNPHQSRDRGRHHRSRRNRRYLQGRGRHHHRSQVLHHTRQVHHHSRQVRHRSRQVHHRSLARLFHRHSRQFHHCSRQFHHHSQFRHRSRRGQCLKRQVETLNVKSLCAGLLYYRIRINTEGKARSSLLLGGRN